jgi:hypothetical protein
VGAESLKFSARLPDRMSGLENQLPRVELRSGDSVGVVLEFSVII